MPRRGLCLTPGGRTRDRRAPVRREGHEAHECLCDRARHRDRSPLARLRRRLCAARPRPLHDDQRADQIDVCPRQRDQFADPHPGAIVKCCEFGNEERSGGDFLGKKADSVRKIVAAYKKSTDPLVFADVCAKSGAKYPQDVEAAMFALESVGSVERLEVKVDGKRSVAYRWVA